MAFNFLKNGIAKIKVSNNQYNLEAAKKNDSSLGKCPLCGQGEIVKNKAGWGCSQWKTGCKYFIRSEIAGKRITESQARKLVVKGISDFIKGFKNKTGKDFEARLVYRKDENKLEFEFKKA